MDETVAGFILVDLLEDLGLYAVGGCEWFEGSGKLGEHLLGFSDPCLAKQASGGQMSFELSQLFTIESV
jgi:hypothetical protein